MKKILHVLNDLYYKRAESQYEIHLIMDYTKMIKFGDLKLCIVHLHRSVHLLFLCRSKYKVFRIVIFRAYRINH